MNLNEKKHESGLTIFWWSGRPVPCPQWASSVWWSGCSCWLASLSTLPSINCRCQHPLHSPALSCPALPPAHLLARMITTHPDPGILKRGSPDRLGELQSFKLKDKSIFNMVLFICSYCLLSSVSGGPWSIPDSLHPVRGVNWTGYS